MPEIKMPEPPSFGYMDWEGRRDFTAVVYSVSFDKNRREPFTMEIPIAVAANRMRMDMDLSKMNKEASASPLSKMVVINRGDQRPVTHCIPARNDTWSINRETQMTKNPGSKRPK